MTRYTVVIRPEQAGDGARGEATVVVETGPRAPRIVEMTIRASAGEGTSAVTMPSIDLAGVVQALSAGIRPSESAAAPAAPPAPASVAEAPEAPQEPAGTARRGNRPYRQMPPADDLKAVYEQVGTVTAMAAHYGVPRHTAQGWMARLRKMSG